MTAEARILATVIGNHVLAVFVLDPREYHSSGRGLQHARNGYLYMVSQVPLGFIHDDHSAVVQVPNALILFLSLFNDVDVHRFAGKDHGLERVRKLVQVHYLNVLEAGHFIEVKVVGDDYALQPPRELNELQVGFFYVGEIMVRDFYGDVRYVLLHSLENIEAPPSPDALNRLGRIRDMLEFFDNELGDYHCPAYETRFGDVGYSAVYDNTRIQDLRLGHHPRVNPSCGLQFGFLCLSVADSNSGVEKKKEERRRD